MQNTFQANVNGVTTFISVSCRTSEDWYVSGPIVGKGKNRKASILKDHLKSHAEAMKEVSNIVKNGYEGELK